MMTMVTEFRPRSDKRIEKIHFLADNNSDTKHMTCSTESPDSQACAKGSSLKVGHLRKLHFTTGQQQVVAGLGQNNCYSLGKLLGASSIIDFPCKGKFEK